MKAKTLKQLALSGLFLGGLLSTQAQDVSGNYWISGDLKLGTNSSPSGMEITNSSSVGRIDFKSDESEDFDARIKQYGNGGLSIMVTNGSGSNQRTALALHDNGMAQIPQSHLQMGYVNSSVYPKLDMKSSHGSSRLLSLDNDFWIQSDENIRFGAYGGGQEFMIITNDGNTSNTSNGKMGIGISNPINRFHVKTSANDGIRLSSGSSEMMVYEDSDNPNWMSFRPTQGNGILFNNNGDNVIMAINQSTQRVGLGTKLPSAKLDVVGDIRSNVTSGFGISVTNQNVGDAAKGHRVFAVQSDGHVWATELHVDAPTNFPDYVFADDYELMELSELEAYIEEHKHLPNIPSAGEVEAAGNMQVAELLVKQMEKIEELTLYILEQEKELNEQREILEQLRNEEK